MRYGVLADVHANLPALRAAITALDAAGVDGWLVAGDVVGYGARPNECVDEIAGLDPISVAGNHDLIALGRLSDERCIPLAQRSLRWTRSELSVRSRDWLEALPLRAEAADGVVLAHGTLDDPEIYTVSPSQARPQLEEIRRMGARLLVLGHTHRPWAFGSASGIRGHRGRLELDGREATLLNPGAVGQSRELRIRARAMILDTRARTAEFLALRYDTAAARSALRDAGLSIRGLRLLPRPAGAARRGLRRLAYRADAH
jgi:predicted phosphodiesterase